MIDSLLFRSDLCVPRLSFIFQNIYIGNDVALVGLLQKNLCTYKRSSTSQNQVFNSPVYTFISAVVSKLVENYEIGIGSHQVW